MYGLFNLIDWLYYDLMISFHHKDKASDNLIVSKNTILQVTYFLHDPYRNYSEFKCQHEEFRHIYGLNSLKENYTYVAMLFILNYTKNLICTVHSASFYY